MSISILTYIISIQVGLQLWSKRSISLVITGVGIVIVMILIIIL